jgi:nucleoside-triphosphatase THEP1
VETVRKRRKTEPHRSEFNDTVTVSKKSLLEVLVFEQMEDRLMNIRANHTKTCQWFLESAQYQSWVNLDNFQQHKGILWIKGKPGSGKSTMMKFAFREINRKMNAMTKILSFFFSAQGHELEKTTLGLYRSLLYQLIENIPEDKAHWNLLTSTNRLLINKISINYEVLKDLFSQVIKEAHFPKLMIIIDALDECNEDDVRDMIYFLEQICDAAVAAGTQLRVMFSSRYYPHITIPRSIELRLDVMLGHTNDIKDYVSSELKIGNGSYLASIKDEIQTRAAGIFMWIVLVIPLLNKAFDRGKKKALRKTLDEIPNDLNRLFRDILTRDNEEVDYLKLCLQFLLFSERPMNLRELYQGLHIGIEPQDLDLQSTDDKDVMHRFILSSSKGLAEITKSETVQFIHESVRDYLLKHDGFSQLWPECSNNIDGLSHERLKKCCFSSSLMRIETYDQLLNRKPVLEVSSSFAAGVHAQDTRFPFLRYAVNCGLYHADMAHAHGVNQLDFITKDFSLSLWIKLENMLRPHHNGYPENIGLMYVLADNSWHNLIEIAKPENLHTWVGSFGNPIFVARDVKTIEAVAKHDPVGSDGYHQIRYPLDKWQAPFFADIKHCERSCERFLRWISLYNVEELWDKVGDKIINYASHYIINAPLKLEESIKTLMQLLLSRFGDRFTKDQAKSFWWSIHCDGALEEQIHLATKNGAHLTYSSWCRRGAIQFTAKHGLEEPLGILLEDDTAYYFLTQHRPYSSPLCLAARGAHTPVIRLILDRVGESMSPVMLGTALAVVSARGSMSAVQLLLDRSVSVNDCDDGETPALHGSIQNHHSAITQLLIEHGADINMVHNGFTALHQASIHGLTNVAKLLLDRGADLSIPYTFWGPPCSALDLALKYQQPQVAELLIAHGASLNQTPMKPAFKLS